MIDVVIAVILDADHRVLLTKRQAHQDFAEHWEFPGGKVALGESMMQALQRELYEELNVLCVDAEPFIQVPWQYAHKSVCLHGFIVKQWQGDAYAAEGQVMQWFDMTDLLALTMPDANAAIVSALMSQYKRR